MAQAANGQLIDAVTNRAPPGSGPETTRLWDELTERERSVAKTIAKGLSNAQIADELGISNTTVKTHIGRILTKLEVNNRVQITAIVQRSEF